MSSPVKLAGAGNHSTRPRSISFALRRTDVAQGGMAGRGHAAAQSLEQRRASPGPDTRITAMAASPAPLASAKMVSFGVDDLPVHCVILGPQHEGRAMQERIRR